MTASQVYPSMAPLFDIFNGPVKMAVLEAAIELNLARVLEDHSDLNAIAGALGIDIDLTGLGLFLDAAVAMGMAEKKKGQYANTDFGRHFLDSASPVFMGGLVKNMKAMQHQNLDKIIEIIKTGPPEVQRNQHLSSEAKWESAVRHLAAYQRAGMASLCADIVQDLPEFTRAEKILDLGGGPGIIGARMLRRLPGARGVLADLPAIIRLARKEIEKEGLSHRMSFIAGDYNDTDLGSGYQIIWASHNLYYVRDRAAFFKRIKNALTPDGVFVCLHEGLTCERTAPASVVLPRLSLALEGQDVSFDKGEIAECLDLAGFARVKTRMLSLPAGEGELVIARPHEKAGS